MRENYRDEKGNKVSKKSFCAYLDILGFKQKIQENNLEYLWHYLSCLDNELSDIHENINLSEPEEFKRYELKIFTDNFVFGHPWYDEYGENELGDIFAILAHMQFSFAISDIFIRGAISLSDLYMDEKIVFGTSLVEAYNLESTKAIYPRIILSQEVVSVIHKHLGYHSEKLESPTFSEYLIDTDGFHFVNYLQVILDRDDNDTKTVFERLIKHKNIICKNLLLNESNYKLFDKYSWSAKYHNYFCDNFLEQYDKIDLNEVKIKFEEIEKNIKRII